MMNISPFFVRYNNALLGKFCLNFKLFSASLFTQVITENTVETRNHLTPEISLRLITPSCKLWWSRYDKTVFPSDPFWAFYWPGGQALTRFILDNPLCVRGKRVTDIGSGCGGSAIASVMSGASSCLANDICPVAVEAINMNAAANNVILETNSADLIGCAIESDVVIIGDLLYDECLAKRIVDWLPMLTNCTVLIGDPGRIAWKEMLGNTLLRALATYNLTPELQAENNGLSSATVWQVSCR